MTNGAEPTLGRLTRVEPREVWRHEAQNFTPWLLANADVLSDLLGMDLELQVAEHPVGGFSLDILGRDAASGGVVIVENQLETSDHTHLGQILTYAAGTNPSTIVWIAPTFRPEHRAAIDWLNTRTDENTRFFAVEIGVVRIGDSAPAPMFKLVAQPNDWEKTVRAASTAASGRSERAELYRAFWDRWIQRVRAAHPDWTRAAIPPKDSWISMSAKSPGASFYISFTQRGFENQLVFEHPDADVNTSRFERFRDRRDVIDGAHGGTLEYLDRPGAKSTAVVDVLLGAAVKDTDQWTAYIDWAINSQRRLRTAIGAIGGLPGLLPSAAPAMATADVPDPERSG